MVNCMLRLVYFSKCILCTFLRFLHLVIEGNVCTGSDTEILVMSEACETIINITEQ